MQLCISILENEYKSGTVADYLTERERCEGEYIVVFRHDIDRKPLHALKMAQAEASLGIRSTYYFRVKAHTLKPAIVQKIAQLGHEVGYHYENLADAGGNMERAIRDFESNLKKLRRLSLVKTICMHGRPLSKWDNRDLWKEYDYKEFGLIGEPYLSIDYTDIVYLSDTGRSWSSNRFNLRDKVSSDVRIRIGSTTELIRVLGSKEYKTFFIQCHPERWCDQIIGCLLSVCFDTLANAGKGVVKAVRTKR